jgi:hypothetical protein
MRGVERLAAVVIRAGAKLAAMMHRAKRYHPEVIARVGQVMHFHRPSAANQARQARDLGHMQLGALPIG